jgi:hypothetical protein
MVSYEANDPKGLNPLQISSTWLLASFLFFVANSLKNTTECALGGGILSCYFLSELFWTDGIRGSIIHRIDGAMAKVNIIGLLSYTSIYKRPPPHYYVVVSLTTAAFYLSDRASRKQWLSPQHVCIHSFFHMCCFFASIYAFL